MYIDTYLTRKCNSSFKKLAIAWAPINYQYISLDKNNYETKKDLLCPVNFGCKRGSNQPNERRIEETSKCWNTKIVRQRLAEANLQDLLPFAYYSLAVTDTHYFILYAYYHADDDTHPNDLEGCLLILERNEDRPSLLGMITVAHDDFVPFVYKGRMKVISHPPWQRDFRMEVEEEPEGDHPLIQQEQGKHGMYSLGKNIALWVRLKRRFLEILGKPKDIIVYYPGENATPYTEERLHVGKGTPYNPSFYYELIDLLDGGDGLWNKYLDAQRSGGNLTFTKDGAFHSEGGLGRANGPWLWEPRQLFDTVEKGAMWNNPAALVRQMFRSTGKEFGTGYRKKMMDRFNSPSEINEADS